MKVALVLLVLLLGGVLVEGERPELVGSSVWYSPNATLLNTNFDLAIVQMVRCFVCLLLFWGRGLSLGFSDAFFVFFVAWWWVGFFSCCVFDFLKDFDQPLYTNGHSFLCPESDQECPPLSCKACDWSVQEVLNAISLIIFPNFFFHLSPPYPLI